MSAELPLSAELLLKGLPDAVILVDGSGKINGWYGASEALLGWTSEEADGHDLHQLLRPRLHGGEAATLTSPEAAISTSGGEPPPQRPEREVLVKAKNDSEVWVGVGCGAVVEPEEGPAQYVVSLRDISERKGVDLAKSDVISAVAHELRSPLTSIKGFASTLVRRWDRFDDDRRRQILTTIESDADRVTRLITELLDLSRLEEGRLQLRKQPVQVPQIAERVVGQMKERSATHSLACDFPNPFPTVMADPDKVEQVLTNLIENALKYTERGRVHIGGAIDDSAVRIAVRDEGGGIPADNRRDVFRKFFRRADHVSPSAAAPPGSGLGLYISKGLIEAHGGTIWVDEAPGGGASFAFTLPLS